MRILAIAIFLFFWLGIQGCTTNQTTPSPTFAATATITRLAPTATIAPRTSPIPASNKTPAPAEVVLRWDGGASIADVDDVSDIVIHLKDTPGIVDGFGDEIQITILYDPQKISVEMIQRKLADFGYRTRKP